MKANVINLEHRKDRLDHIKDVLNREKIEISIHKATNGQEKFFDMFKNKRMKAHAGCYDSHVTLLEKVKGTADYHLILEDDCELIDGFKNKVIRYIELLPKNYTMLYLGGSLNVFKNSIELLNQHFSLAKKVMATHAYLVNDLQIDFILSILKKRIYKIDIMFMDIQQSVDVYITNECLAWQRETYSDIIFDVMKTNTKY